MFTHLFPTDCKRALRHLRATLLSMTVLSLFLTLLAIFATRVLQRSDAIYQAEVSVVAADPDDPLLAYALRYASEVDSASAALRFVLCSEAEAARALSTGRSVAIVRLPEHIVQGILNGTNTPVTIAFAPDSSVNTLVLSEVTRAATRMLADAQTASYTAAWLYDDLGAADALPRAYDDIDLINFSYVLEREKLYAQAQATPGGLVPLSEGTSYLTCYYAASALMLLFFFAPISLAPALQREEDDFCALYLSRGRALPQAAAYAVSRFLACWAMLSMLFLCILGLLLTLLQEPLGTDSDSLLPHLGTVCAITAYVVAYALFLQLLLSTSRSAILVHILLAAAMAYASGALLPAAFLPGALRRIGAMLPTTPLHQACLSLLTTRATPPLFAIGLHTVALLLLAIAAFVLRCSPGASRGGHR